MEPSVRSCPKCNAAMERGFVLDHSQQMLQISHWVAGLPKKSFWTGIQYPREKKPIPVGTFRCTACGYLESYAMQEHEAK